MPFLTIDHLGCHLTHIIGFFGEVKALFVKAPEGRRDTLFGVVLEVVQAIGENCGILQGIDCSLSQRLKSPEQEKIII